jgi:hypothetical protein
MIFVSGFVGLGTLSAILLLPGDLNSTSEESPHQSPHLVVANGGEVPFPDGPSHGTEKPRIVEDTGETTNLSQNDAKTQKEELAGVTGLEPIVFCNFIEEFDG